MFISDIVAPNKERVHADLIAEGNGQYRVEWTPRMSGIPVLIIIPFVLIFLMQQNIVNVLR